MTPRERRYRRRLDRLAERLRADGRERYLIAKSIEPFIAGPVRLYVAPSAPAPTNIEEILHTDGSPRAPWIELTAPTGVTARAKPAFSEMAGWEPRP